ncbi:unnamed protein product [Arabidopsis lyrata]|uniref:Zinc finger (B-box type) family protein n=1 Tax=Arabidopsis lyrata subsp. lyrata TaxID=81972 RepID=D7LY29_ARALL|nr:B-box zinc finger protein 23 [Arabidopsis lyrata subsp. lyrata]XP_020878462.1 B-box zinc finger protein 23 [Arabidopsis lyrata subsp. lyrata]EFH50872.1 zinc finger (B-box type) family protein [Arabidopsis lyrata subsp. lyrata]CAH8272814.1 unnamed protein product [Arabidopsis lyrata]|eukprot:XP_002874613.1 B-box zinc finger protein 23 [Arabidopsis lyrata subsp. lyrata]
MKIQCEVCEKAEAEVLCCSDEAVLCKPCDIKVHEANKIFQRHHRVALHKDASSATTASGAPLCDICQERKGYFFCLEDRALLCNDCDGAIHTCNSHQRFLLSGVQVSDQSLTENSECSTSFGSETCQIQSKVSLNSQYSSEETEAGNSGEIVHKNPSVILRP